MSSILPTEMWATTLMREPGSQSRFRKNGVQVNSPLSLHRLPSRTLGATALLSSSEHLFDTITVPGLRPGFLDRRESARSQDDTRHRVVRRPASEGRARSQCILTGRPALVSPTLTPGDYDLVVGVLPRLLRRKPGPTQSFGVNLRRVGEFAAS